MKPLPWLGLGILVVGLSPVRAETGKPASDLPVSPASTRLKVSPPDSGNPADTSFRVPLPAHAASTSPTSPAPRFRVVPGRSAPAAKPEESLPPAEYLLPDRDEKPPITPENANLNLPEELVITATDTGETITLPAGTYRQILQLPIDSPLMRTVDQTRSDQAPPVSVPRPASRYAEPEKKPIWVRYESLEKIKIGEAERRGGIDLPSHGPKELGPRVWYAKSETADVASSVFYFVFGGLGYSTANLLGWSAGNTREIPGEFEYRLIRR